MTSLEWACLALALLFLGALGRFFVWRESRQKIKDEILSQIDQALYEKEAELFHSSADDMSADENDCCEESAEYHAKELNLHLEEIQRLLGHP